MKFFSDFLRYINTLIYSSTQKAIFLANCLERMHMAPILVLQNNETVA